MLLPNEPLLMPNQYLPFNGDEEVCKEFLSIKEKFGVTTSIELGSCVGGTTRWLAENFEKVITIEINEQFRNICLQRIAGLKNVQSILGDTVKWLPQVLKDCDDKTIIHVDSHWSDNNPLLKELEIIAESGLKPCLMIHDMLNPNHPEYQYDEYPNEGIIYNWDYIAGHIRNIYTNGFSLYYNDKSSSVVKIGCLFIVPK